MEARSAENSVMGQPEMQDRETAIEGHTAPRARRSKAASPQGQKKKKKKKKKKEKKNKKKKRQALIHPNSRSPTSGGKILVACQKIID